MKIIISVEPNFFVEVRLFDGMNQGNFILREFYFLTHSCSANI